MHFYNIGREEALNYDIDNFRKRDYRRHKAWTLWYFRSNRLGRTQKPKTIGSIERNLVNDFNYCPKPRYFGLVTDCDQIPFLVRNQDLSLVAEGFSFSIGFSSLNLPSVGNTVLIRYNGIDVYQGIVKSVSSDHNQLVLPNRC
jgi:hypothetical protein